MKWQLFMHFFILFSLSLGLCQGSEEFFDVQWVDDTTLQNYQIKLDQKIYRDEKRSQINWHEIDVKKWLSLKTWAKQRIVKDMSLDWIVNQKDLNNIELMGRMLECVGECRIYRGRGHARGQFLSSIKEGDEISTMADSYAWIFMFDGSLVRLSPLSSISVKEINIGREKIFLHVRINSGNVLWLARSKQKLLEMQARETDTLFLPLDFYAGNQVESKQSAITSQNLFAAMEKEKDYKAQYILANKLLLENNKMIGTKKTQTFLVMSNGTVYGEDLQMEFVVLLGDKSYIKNRAGKWYLQTPQQEKQEPAPVKFIFRGYGATPEADIRPSIWYEIAQNGKKIKAADTLVAAKFVPGEYPTKRIGSFFHARELLLKKYSRPFFDNKISQQELGLKYGYRLWGKVNLYKNKYGNLQYAKDLTVAEAPISSDEFEKRLDFLKEYTRRTETTGILVREKFRKISLKRGELVKNLTYGDHFYRMALDNYVRKEGLERYANDDSQVLNSTMKPFWHMLNARKRKSRE